MIAGIVVALPEELGTLTDKQIEKRRCVFIAKQVMVVYAGAGCQNAQTAAELLVAKGATHLMSWGCAAGLSPGLRAGDLVLPTTVIDMDSAEIAIDPDWHGHSKQMLSKSLVVHEGSLLTTQHVIAPSKEKKQLHNKTGAVALDMESVAIAKIARQHSVPFLAIRVIADSVNASLPSAINKAMDAQGEVVKTKLLLSIALNPLDIPRLIRLGMNFHTAKKTLQQVAKQLDGIVAVKPGSAMSV